MAENYILTSIKTQIEYINIVKLLYGIKSEY